MNDAETNVLQRSTMKLVNITECASLHKKYNITRTIDNSVVCVKPAGETNLCIPDNGGHITELVDMKPAYQFGVGSFTFEKCSHDLPFVYTKVYPHLKWILDTVRK